MRGNSSESFRWLPLGAGLGGAVRSEAEDSWIYYKPVIIYAL